VATRSVLCEHRQERLDIETTKRPIPKSLYQGPSGASGSLSRHSFNSYKSSVVIWRSRARSKR